MRTDILFNQGWEFLLSDQNFSLKSGSYPASGLSPDMNPFPDEEPFLHEIWKTVSLPHDWDVEYELEENAPSGGGGGYARTGIGWYRKRFSLTPQEISGRHVTLLFEGVYMNASVWLNGVFLGHHNYGYTPFILPLDKALITGEAGEENTLLVRVDNSAQPGSRWYSGSGMFFDTDAQKELTAMLRRDFNHPSVILWSIRNEIPEQSSKDGVALVEFLQGICHREDSTRMVTCACDNIASGSPPAPYGNLKTPWM